VTAKPFITIISYHYLSSGGRTISLIPMTSTDGQTTSYTDKSLRSRALRRNCLNCCLGMHWATDPASVFTLQKPATILSSQDC